MLDHTLPRSGGKHSDPDPSPRGELPIDGELALTALRGVVRVCGGDAALVFQQIVNADHPIPLERLAGMVGLDEQATREALGRLEAAGLVVPVGYAAVFGAVL